MLSKMVQSLKVAKQIIKKKLDKDSILFERFKIKKELGQGGYGRVYMAVDLQDKTDVAVKVAYGGGIMKERNVIESEMLEFINNIRSDLVVKMKTKYVMDECVVIVLELLSNDFWKTIAHMGPNKLEEISIYAKQMLEFLSFFSSIDLIHGDIKPGNILVQEKRHQIKFSDFGLTQRSTEEYKLKKIQTLNYRAPEILLKLDYTPSVDMWSLGCVLLECLLGEVFFQVKSEHHLLKHITAIFGNIDDDVVDFSDEKLNFYYYNDEYECFIVRGFHKPITPMGLIKYIREFCPNIIIDDDCELFLNLIEGMMQLRPEERYTPEKCLKHQFFIEMDLKKKKTTPHMKWILDIVKSMSKK